MLKSNGRPFGDGQQYPGRNLFTAQKNGARSNLKQARTHAEDSERGQSGETCVCTDVPKRRAAVGAKVCKGDSWDRQERISLLEQFAVYYVDHINENG